MENIIILRQRPIIAFDFDDTIADSATEYSEQIAVVGLRYISGCIYSDQDVTLYMEEGLVHTAAGVVTWRWSTSDAIVAGVARKLEYTIDGKYLRMAVNNSSGNTANVEAYFECRGMY
jgi:hypothetical protein